MNSKFKQKLGSFIAPALWPKNDSGQLSFNKADLERAKNLTKKELKNGSIRPLLDNSEFEDIITGKIRCPNYLITKVQLALIKDDGVKYTFNILSKDNLKRLLFGTSNTPSLLKEQPLSTTPTGQPQVDDDFLEFVKDKYVWIPLLQRYNSLTKIKSTYVDRFLEESENGVFYPSFYQHRTTSGRYSGDFQQLPRIKNEEEEPDDVVREYTSRIRNFFIAGPGNKIISADYSSLEVVVFADDAADEPLLNIIRNKEDFYSRLAILVYGLHEYSADKSAPNFLKKHKPEVRQAAKAFALGIRYGLGDYKLHKDLGISQEEAKRIVSSYFTSFPNLKKRMDELQNDAKTKGFVKSKAGRIRHLPEVPKLMAKWGDCILNGLELWKEWHDHPEQYADAKRDARILNNLLNNALNFPIQSFAASIVNKASIELAKKFRKDGINAYIAANVHDEIVVISSEKDVDKTCEYMREYMENTTKLLVPLEAEPIAGNRYGEVK
jgi:DNA polymerase-1